MGITINEQGTHESGLSFSGKYINIYTSIYNVFEKKDYIVYGEWASREAYLNRLGPLKTSDKIEVTGVAGNRNAILQQAYEQIKQIPEIEQCNPIDVLE